ncbi:hypothetical protein [Paracoccus jiaweipingae]|uniref:hypothetical protein n=1 Tax=unclassified Paracoccus (in: a-proteobacteria) TaxID=2688777 RepID=UPI003798B4AD
MSDHTGSTLNIFFMAEPGPLEPQAHLLVSALKVNCQDGFRLQAFCRQEKIDGLHPETLSFFEANNVALTPLENQFSDNYPAGNKLFASSKVSGADWHLFLDTDTLLLKPGAFLSDIAPNHVGMCLDTVNGWSDDEGQWDLLFAKYPNARPVEKVTLGRGAQSYPVYNAGFVLFPDAPRHFGQIWLETALEKDQQPGLARKRPWLDTCSLLPALADPDAPPLQVLDSRWNQTTELADAETMLVHYHGLRQLISFGWEQVTDQILAASDSPFDNLRDLVSTYRNWGVEGDLFRRAMRHGMRG